MVGELGKDPLDVDSVHTLERFADSEMELGAAYRGKTVVQGAPNELVREPV
jgi:hypothetical protein